ncbi:hypothetical protein Aperf_G00000130560 [Anoplocephala perfoliata]
MSSIAGGARPGANSSLDRWITQNRPECPHCRSHLQLQSLINCRWADDVVQQLRRLKTDVKASRSPGNTDLCESHQERLTVFCCTCDHSICHRCALFDGRHGKHNFRPLDDVYEEHLRVVMGELETLSVRLREIQALIKEVGQNVLSLNRRKESRVDEIKSYVEALIFRLESSHRKKLSALNGQLGHLKQEEELLTSLLDEVESQLKTTSPANLISRSSALTAMFAEVHNTPMPTLNFDPSFYDLPSELVPPWSVGEFVIHNFSQVRQQVEPIYGSPLECGALTWRLKVYPNGNGVVRGQYLSVFLEMTSGRSDPSKYEYSIQLVHQGPPPSSSKCITREFASDFAVGECWGYNRFIQLFLLEAEDYISRTDDTLRFKYMVRPQTYELKYRDCLWQVEQLNREKTQLEAKIRQLEEDSRRRSRSNSAVNPRPASSPSLSLRPGNGSRGDFASGNLDTSPDFERCSAPTHSAVTPLTPSRPLNEGQATTSKTQRPRSTSSEPLMASSSPSNHNEHANDADTPQVIDSFDSDATDNDADTSSSSGDGASDVLRLESPRLLAIDDEAHSSQAEEAEDGLVSDADQQNVDAEQIPGASQSNGSNMFTDSTSRQMFMNGLLTPNVRHLYPRHHLTADQRCGYVDRLLQRVSSRPQENAADDGRNGQSDETFYELIRRLQNRRPVRSRSDFASEDAYLEYLLTSPDVDSFPTDFEREPRSHRRRPNSGSPLSQSSVIATRSASERIMDCLETDLFPPLNALPSNGEPITSRSSPIDVTLLSPASSLSASTRMNLEVIRRRMRELSGYAALIPDAFHTPNMSTDSEREFQRRSVSSTEMAASQADANENNC